MAVSKVRGDVSSEPQAPAFTPLSQAEVASLLDRTSRTFALTIPLLDEPLATDVGLSYLLLRLADTLEDGAAWGRDKRLAALESFGVWLSDRSEDRDRDEPTWLRMTASPPPTCDAGCLALIARAEALKTALADRGPEVSSAVTRDVVRTSSKMAEFVARQTENGGLVLRDLSDLRAYCYAVAGIVGELLTELFVLRCPELTPARAALMRLAPAFGEGLQLVNVLKDASSDALEGRSYIPLGVARAELFALARRNLVQARDYVNVLRNAGARAHVLQFCELPTRLAEATLDRLEHGTPKLTRAEVAAVYNDVTQ